MTLHRAQLCCAASLVLVCGVLLSAQIKLPGAPQTAAGAGVTPAFEGWFDNADGTRSFLIGYYSRNTEAEVDAPIGRNNYFEPGEQDRGQPTHFFPRRNYGMFTVTVSGDFTVTDRLTWHLSVNNQPVSIPFRLNKDYNLSPFEASEESPNGGFNTPPTLMLWQGPSFKGPVASLANIVSRTASVGTPMRIDFSAEDDGLYSSGTNVERTEGTPVTLSITKYRGPGEITVDEGEEIEFDAPMKGGKPGEDYSAKGSTTVSFSEPGDYWLHVLANDLSGRGGGGSGCCWTTTLVKVAVSD